MVVRVVPVLVTVGPLAGSVLRTVGPAAPRRAHVWLVGVSPPRQWQKTAESGPTGNNKPLRTI